MENKNELAIRKGSIVKNLGLQDNQYKDCTFGGENFAMKIPSTRELIRMESRNATETGEINLSGYIEEICELLLPKTTLDKVAEISDIINIKVGEKAIVLSNVTAKKALDIVNNSSRMERDKEDPKKMILRPNTEEMLEQILALSEEKLDIDDFKYKEIKSISSQFEAELKVDTLMEMYGFFQRNFQA